MSLTDKEQITQILTELKVGSILTKREHNGEQHSRHYFLHEQEHFLSYQQSKKTFGKATRYYIERIDEIRTGYNTRTFDRLVRHKSIEQNDEKCAFSIFYNNYRDELHLMANDEQTRDKWVQGLRYLINSHGQKRQQHIINETNWIMHYFYLADKDGSGALTKQECYQLLFDSFNAKISKNTFEILFKKADKSGEGILTSDEFIQFFHLLTRRRDLYKIMQKYVKNGVNQSIDTIYMSIDELLFFLQNIQNQTIITYPSNKSKSQFSLQLITTREHVQDLIHEFEPNRDYSKIA